MGEAQQPNSNFKNMGLKKKKKKKRGFPGGAAVRTPCSRRGRRGPGPGRRAESPHAASCGQKPRSHVGREMATGGARGELGSVFINKPSVKQKEQNSNTIHKNKLKMD